MNHVTAQDLAALQSQTERIRNICILAHVDHGKTTLSDHLIGSNGLIHPRMVGELRYLDSRDDEQARGITMKSSSIGLLHIPGAAGLPGSAPASPTPQDKLEKGYLINLIDSPGHVDFCSEVSAAARLSDGALVVVDAVEGVCIQTHAVLRQAWHEQVRLCLVINKVDRLVLEVGASPAEAYERMRGIVAHVNMILSAFRSEQLISDADAVLATEDARAAQPQDAGGAEEVAGDEEGEEPVFAPEKGNVAFASAADGWAFRVGQFAALYAAKMGANPKALARTMWGDYAYQAKARRIVRIRPEQQGKAKPLFVQLALDPLWRAYEACAPGADARSVLERIVKGLALEQVPAKALVHPEARTALRAVLRAWLPLSEAVLGMAVDQLPSPRQAAPQRLPRLLPLSEAHAPDAQLPADIQEGVDAARAAVLSCAATPPAPAVVYVAKMLAVPASSLPRGAAWDPNPGTDPADEVFLAFGRVFAGMLRDGDCVHVLSAAYDPAVPALHRQEAQVRGLYMMMGRGLEALTEVPAGCVVAIGGLGAAILKSATLASSPACRPLAPMLFQAAPIVRVAIEPADPSQMAALATGLRLLNRADPFVEVTVQESGEHVVGAAGEVHLETILKDLRERFARCELAVSPPLVAFRESVADNADMPEAAMPRPAGIVEAATANGALVLRALTEQEAVRMVPIRVGTPEAAALLGFCGRPPPSGGAAPVIANGGRSGKQYAQGGNECHPEEGAAVQQLQHSVEAGIVAGFQLATAAGPLCDEPLWGVALEVEARLRCGADGALPPLAEEVYGPMSGQVTSVVRQAARRAVSAAGPRLVEAMLLCEVAAAAEALSGVYAVLGRRRARIVREELREGSGHFSVHAFLPMQASFGLADELRRRCSGAAPQSDRNLHVTMQVDPFFVPTTEEEREEFGEAGQGAGAPNLARTLVDEVRRRKGLLLDRKVVESATKQRTRARKV
ncbi:hypothetical protein WJX81_005694 [Elliptochloris bilobata]|uniref:Tr-type G domain-containing protein n=1 Tax=Elliptochloris bilobata TaxID=381761 RepID=A0AAW1RBI6_9CHLO